MGVILSVMIVKGKTERDVKSIFMQLSAGNPEWDLVPKACCYLPREQGVMVLLNEQCCGFEQLAKHCSEALKNTVMLTYIYDGDYWGYFLFDQGRAVDCYAAIPDYFEELTEQEIQSYAGNGAVIASYFAVAPERISKYLQRWTEEQLGCSDAQYAYDGDKYSIGNGWQMSDFLRAIGWPYEW